MYFVLTDNKTVAMKPSDLGPMFDMRLDTQLRLELEGSLSKNHDGTIVHIINIIDKSKPKIQDGTGMALVNVIFQGIVFRPFKNEVMDCWVSEVSKLGFFGYFGPMKVFVSRSSMPDDVIFREAATPVCYSDADQTVVIQQDSEVRVRIMGVRRDGNQLFAIGTINADYLGPSIAPALPNTSIIGGGSSRANTTILPQQQQGHLLPHTIDE
ncbi:DNA-directed RNA polymerase II subunit RPB7 [Perkinsus olseni]|uniref:DNA-directed RNA polymerase II subunit RPB7 n=1 Tax=Perkinsus olseni TaxID=32597 RepID=A0A7J6SAE7_PEROL|nr:DNA-directed RNA polymerase II subunit RPB7 [Perkinsus olseni]